MMVVTRGGEVVLGDDVLGVDVGALVELVGLLVGRVGALVELVGCPVRLIDERFSTATAAQAMRSAGRDSRRQRAVIDQAAAVVILENALDIDKNGNLDAVTIELPRKGMMTDLFEVEAESTTTTSLDLRRLREA